MEIKTLLRYWNDNIFLFDVKIIEKRKARVVAEGRALVSTKKGSNGKYAGHCCLVGEDAYTENNCRKDVVGACVKRARLLQNNVINYDANEQTPMDMIYVSTDE